MNEKFIKEDRAKDILLKTNKKKYGGLIKSESPDYHNNNVGIEITDATSDLEFLSFFNNNCNTSVEKLNVKLLKKNSNNKRLQFIQDANLKIVGYKTEYFTYSFSFMENVCSLLNKKFKLLNTTYSLFESNELIIIISELYNEILINDENLYEGIIYTIKTLYSGNEYTIKFDEIHLLFQDLLLSIKTLDWNYKKFPLKTLLN